MRKIHPLMQALAMALILTGTTSAADLQTAPAQAAALQDRTSFDGVVEAVYYAAKEQVKEGVELVAITAASARSS